MQTLEFTPVNESAPCNEVNNDTEGSLSPQAAPCTAVAQLSGMSWRKIDFISVNCKGEAAREWPFCAPRGRRPTTLIVGAEQAQGREV